MTITDTILKLEELRHLHGDLEVTILNESYEWYGNELIRSDTIHIHKDQNKLFCAIDFSKTLPIENG